MDVILVCPDFVVPDLVPLLYAEADFLERLRDFGSEDVLAVLRGADEVVQEEVLVVTLDDVVAHPLILTSECPRSRASRKSFRL